MHKEGLHKHRHQMYEAETKYFYSYKKKCRMKKVTYRCMIPNCCHEYYELFEVASREERMDAYGSKI